MAATDLYSDSKSYVRLTSNQRPDGGSEVFWFCLNTMRWRWQNEDRTTLYDDVDDRLAFLGEASQPSSAGDRFYSRFFLDHLLKKLNKALPDFAAEKMDFTKKRLEQLGTCLSYDDILCCLVEIEEDIIADHMDIRLQGRRLIPTEFHRGRIKTAVAALRQLIPELMLGGYANFGSFLGVCVSYRENMPLQISTHSIVDLWREAIRRGDNERST